MKEEIPPSKCLQPPSVCLFLFFVPVLLLCFCSWRGCFLFQNGWMYGMDSFVKRDAMVVCLPHSFCDHWLRALFAHSSYNFHVERVSLTSAYRSAPSGVLHPLYSRLILPRAILNLLPGWMCGQHSFVLFFPSLLPSLFCVLSPLSFDVCLFLRCVNELVPLKTIPDHTLSRPLSFHSTRSSILLHHVKDRQKEERQQTHRPQLIQAILITHSIPETEGAIREPRSTHRTRKAKAEEEERRRGERRERTEEKRMEL